MDTQAYQLSDLAQTASEGYTHNQYDLYDSSLGLFYSETTDQNGHSTKTYADAEGRTVRTVYDDGSFTQTLYGVGDSAVNTDQEGDALPDVPSVPAGETEQATIAQRKAGDPLVVTYDLYDASGNLTDVYQPAVIDGNPLDTTTHNTLVQPHTHYTYDSAGNETAQTDAEDHTTTFGYDQNGNQVLQSLPDGESESWAYNADSQVSSHTDFDGNTATYTYLAAGDPNAGSLQQVVYNPATGSMKPAQTVSYTYNALGQQTTVNDASGTTANSYDDWGNLIESITPEGTIYYVFDPATGNHTETYTANTKTDYGYDNQGHLTSVTVKKLDGTVLSPYLVTNYTYDPAGNKLTETLPDGEVTTYTYDDLNRLTNVLEKQGSTTLFSQAYTLNADGTRASSTESQLQPSGSTTTTDSTWTYDANGRLAGEAISSSTSANSFSNTYAYDLASNRISDVHTGPGGGATATTTYTYNGDDELTSQTSGGVTTTNSYDANGSLLSSSSSAGTQTYTYDVRNKLASATVNGVTTTYVYDDAGDRVAETTGGVTTKYLTDTANATGYDQPLEETVGTGTTPTHTYLTGERVFGQANSSGAVSYLLIDGHGSTEAITTSSGAITSTFSYDAFGGAIGFTPATAGTEYLFGGDALYDPATGLYFHGDGVRERLGFEFIERDSFPGFSTDPASLHKYLYAQAQPISGDDPTGRVFGLDDIAATAGDEADETAEESGVGSAAEEYTEGVVDDLEITTEVDDDYGEYAVYQSLDGDGEVQYVGITNNLARRAGEHYAANGIEIDAIEGLTNLSQSAARAVEQALINLYGLGTDGYQLLNVINSIAESNPIYAEALEQGLELLNSVGYGG